MWVQGLESVILMGPFHLGTFWAVKPGRKRLGMTVRPPVNHGFLRTNLPASPGRQLSRSLRETGAGGEAGSGAGRRGAALAVGPARPLPAGRAGRCQRARGGAVVARAAVFGCRGGGGAAMGCFFSKRRKPAQGGQQQGASQEPAAGEEKAPQYSWDQRAKVRGGGEGERNAVSCQAVRWQPWLRSRREAACPVSGSGAA